MPSRVSHEEQGKDELFSVSICHSTSTASSGDQSCVYLAERLIVISFTKKCHALVHRIDIHFQFELFQLRAA